MGRRWSRPIITPIREEAIAILRAAVARETEAPIGYMQLAMAYGRKGDLAQADLASAQAAYLRGDNKTARDLAARAKTRFPIGSPAGSRPTTSSLPGRCPARSATRNNPRWIRYRPTGSRNDLANQFVQEDLPMRSFRLLAPALFALALCAAPRRPPRRSSPTSSAAISRSIVREYLLKHPEVLEEAMAELEQAPERGRSREACRGSEQERGSDLQLAAQVTVGNPRTAMSPWSNSSTTIAATANAPSNDMMALMKADPKLKVVLKEFPVLGPGSIEAAQVGGRRAHAGQERQEVSRLSPEDC